MNSFASLGLVVLASMGVVAVPLSFQAASGTVKVFHPSYDSTKKCFVLTAPAGTTTADWDPVVVINEVGENEGTPKDPYAENPAMNDNSMPWIRSSVTEQQDASLVKYWEIKAEGWYNATTPEHNHQFKSGQLKRAAAITILLVRK